MVCWDTVQVSPTSPNGAPHPFFYYALFLFCPFLLIAQEQDFQQWSKIGLSYDFNKDLSVSLDQALRFRENASLADVTFSNLSLKYDLIKKWSVAIGYRYINDFDYIDGKNFCQVLPSSN